MCWGEKSWRDWRREGRREGEGEMENGGGGHEANGIGNAGAQDMTAVDLSSPPRSPPPTPQQQQQQAVSVPAFVQRWVIRNWVEFEVEFEFELMGLGIACNSIFELSCCILVLGGRVLAPIKTRESQQSRPPPPPRDNGEQDTAIFMRTEQTTKLELYQIDPLVDVRGLKRCVHHPCIVLTQQSLHPVCDAVEWIT